MDDSALRRLEREARERTTGMRRPGAEARAAACELCGGGDVRWGSMCERCRLRLRGEDADADAAPMPPDAAPARPAPARPPRRRRRGDGVVHPPAPGAPAAPQPGMSLIQNVPGAVYRTLHDARRTLVFVTQQIRAMTGHDATVLATGAHGLSDLVHPDDLPAVAAALAGAAPGRPVAAEYRLRHADGGVRWVQDSAQLVTGGGRTYLDGVLMDVSGRRQAHEELAWMALHDPLTRLPNRRALDERLLAERTRREREGGALSAVVLDVDHFKKINDRHGHDAGDRALVGVAERLSARAPARGMVARIGGEEFVMLLPGLALPEAVAVAEGVRAHVAAAPIAGLSVTVSAGVAEATGAGDGLLRAADAALYRAKREGRDRVAAATA